MDIEPEGGTPAAPGAPASGIVIASEAGASINDFFAGGGISKGNPILCCTPALAPQLREIAGIS